MKDQELEDKLKSATSLLAVKNSDPTRNEGEEEDWDAEIAWKQHLSNQRFQKMQAAKRIEELYYDVHASTRTTQRSKYKMWYINKFLYSPLLETIPEK